MAWGDDNKTCGTITGGFLVESWFSQLTERRLRKGTFSSVEEFRESIEVWAEHWNDDPKPFIWRKTTEDIIACRQRPNTDPLSTVHF